ncbi:MAG: Tlg2-vesicle protein [Heterodermia speciosa]|uniref:Golgi apparatus membrane protein TVP38 n=1 Tax=Heterodermia speciosa TaxID=116794 RepID=A0A8H3IIF0_9LECA|nr:MAG: Tlg2-vesicle protein [Heterodermia speciosa]
MPADYSSTARALALPISPPNSPPVPHHSKPVAWIRRQSGQPLIRNDPSQKDRGRNLRGSLIENAEKIHRKVYRTMEKMSPLQRALVAFGGIVTLVLAVLFLVFNERIFRRLSPVAVKWKELRGGWLILWAMTFITAFPPVIGYSSCITIAGFVYGFPEGWFIVATATVAGSTCSFIASRSLLSNFVHRLVANDTRFEALSLVLKYDGLKLLCMIRLCPLPYSISNGAISTFPTVEPAMFALATAIITPKLLIHIFIGSRLAAIAKSGEKMDAGTKAINWISIIVGMIIGAVTGWLIYRRTVARSQQLEAEERNKVRGSTTRTAGFSDEPDEQSTGTTKLSDDDIDFLDHDGTGGAYRDELIDDEDDVFRYADADEEDAISLQRQPPRQ